MVAALIALIALGAIALALPGVLAGWILTPDAVDYVGIAHNWVQGRGFVVPVLYSYYLPDVAPPVPGLAVRSPVLPVLFAGPLWLGADLTRLGILHVAWAGAVGGATLLSARRVTSLPASLGYSALVAWSFAWLLFAQQLLTEVTSVALLCAFLLAVRPALRSVPGAIGLGGLTLVAYLTRGNLMVLLPAVLLAAIVDRGPRAALRSAPLWAYAGSVLVLERAAALAVSAVQGIPLYEHYGVMAEILSGSAAARFQTEYVGSTAFLKIHWREVLALLGDNALRTYRLVFADSVYHHAGWFALPAVVWSPA